MIHHSVKTTTHLPVKHANTTWGARWTGGTVDLRWGGFCSVSFCRKRPPLMQHCATFSYLPPSCCAMWEGEREEEEEKRIRRKRRRRYSLPFLFSSGVCGDGVGSSHDFSINNNVGGGGERKRETDRERGLIQSQAADNHLLSIYDLQQKWSGTDGDFCFITYFMQHHQP